jgi:hypothetical protein
MPASTGNVSRVIESILVLITIIAPVCMNVLITTSLAMGHGHWITLNIIIMTVIIINHL